MNENGQKKANVEVRRFEERAPGLGVPAGWMPEIIYHLTATDIPRKADFSVQIGFREPFLLRRLQVKPDDAPSWDIEVKVGPLTVLEKRPAADLSEDLMLSQWPPFQRPMLVKVGLPVIIKLFAKSDKLASDRFECVFRGAEEK
jgi:hypothetical protein